MFCGNCGRKVRLEENFCCYCGCKINRENFSETEFESENEKNNEVEIEQSTFDEEITKSSQENNFQIIPHFYSTGYGFDGKQNIMIEKPVEEISCTKKSNKNILVAKIFIWLGMISGCFLIIPIICGAAVLADIKKAKCKDDILLGALFTLIFCNTIAGIILLTLNDKDFQQNENDN